MSLIYLRAKGAEKFAVWKMLRIEILLLSVGRFSMNVPIYRLIGVLMLSFIILFSGILAGTASPVYPLSDPGSTFDSPGFGFIVAAACFLVGLLSRGLQVRWVAVAVGIAASIIALTGAPQSADTYPDLYVGKIIVREDGKHFMHIKREQLTRLDRVH